MKEYQFLQASSTIYSTILQNDNDMLCKKKRVALLQQTKHILSENQNNKVTINPTKNKNEKQESTTTLLDVNKIVITNNTMLIMELIHSTLQENE